MIIALLAAAAALARPPLPAVSREPVQVMIVGDFHMANPGHDLHNVKVDDMLSAKRQAEIADVDRALGRFRPTVVAAEWSAETVAERYPKFLAGDLPPSHNEVVQLGFRLARDSGARMVGVDVDGDFPYDAVDGFAKAHGQGPLLEAAGAGVQTMVEEQARRLATGSVAGALRYLNDPRRLQSDNDFYRTTLKIGAGPDQPGAALLTAWYQRNLRICANLLQTSRPGDRMVVFYGSGHAFLLRQCIQETPGYRMVEPNGYLPR